MTNHKVEYRGFPVPLDYLLPGLFGSRLPAWKLGVDNVLDCGPVRNEDKTEYFHGARVPSLFFRIDEDGNVSSYDGDDHQFYESYDTEKSIRDCKTPTTRDAVPAEFRLGGDK